MDAHDTHRLSAAGDCFRLMAACFYEPDKPLFLEQAVCSNLAMLLEEISTQAAEAAGEMSRTLNRLEQEQMLVDYAALFIGPSELPAPPYGSVYLEKGRALMGATTLQVQKFYEDVGLQVEEKEPADHIAIELEFMAFLHGREASALQAGASEEADRMKDLREKFFSGWLKPWVADFCTAIRRGGKNPFYVSLADCLEGFIHSYDRQMIALTEDA